MSNVFDQATQPVTPAPQGGDDLTTKLASIVNENGEQKYADVQTALDALKNSQEYIPTLKQDLSSKEQEIAQLREQVAKSQGVQEALERFAQQPQQNEAQPTAPTEPQSVAQEPVDINSLVQAAFQAHQQQTQAEKNLNEVNSVLVSQYGDKAVEHLQNKAKELGTTEEAIREMAKTNPIMAMTLLGTEKPKTSMSYGGANTAGFVSPQSPKLERPSNSMLMGASHTQVNDFMKQIQAEVYREHGIDI